MMDDFGPLSLGRSCGFEFVSDDEDEAELSADRDVYRSIGGCAVASRPAARSFGPQEGAWDSWEPAQPAQHFSKAKTFEPALDCEEVVSDFVHLWQPQLPLQPEPKVAEPKAEPEWVCSSSSLVSNEDASTLLMDIEAVLSEHRTQVSFETTPEKFKIKAVAFSNGAESAQLYIRLYKGKAANVVIEFQRKQGDARTFYNVFHKVVAALGEARVRSYSGEELHQAPKPLPNLDLDGLPDVAMPCAPVPTLTVSTLIIALMSMAREGFLDVKKQALSELVAISKKHAMSLRMHKQEMVPLMLDMLGSTDEELARCAAMVLANLAALEHDVAEPTSWLGPVQLETALARMLDVLAVPRTLFNADTKRHTARAILDVLKTGPPDAHTELRMLSMVCADNVLRRDLIGVC